MRGNELLLGVNEPRAGVISKYLHNKIIARFWIYRHNNFQHSFLVRLYIGILRIYSFTTLASLIGLPAFPP